MKANVVLPLGC